MSQGSKTTKNGNFGDHGAPLKIFRKKKKFYIISSVTGHPSVTQANNLQQFFFT